MSRSFTVWWDMEPRPALALSGSSCFCLRLDALIIIPKRHIHNLQFNAHTLNRATTREIFDWTWKSCNVPVCKNVQLCMHDAECWARLARHVSSCSQRRLADLYWNYVRTKIMGSHHSWAWPGGALLSAYSLVTSPHNTRLYIVNTGSQTVTPSEHYRFLIRFVWPPHDGCSEANNT